MGGVQGRMYLTTTSGSGGGGVASHRSSMIGVGVGGVAGRT